MSVRKGGKVIAGNVSHYNIGDTFITKRTDTNLAGAVECNGATYNTTDFTGTGSIGELLEVGKLDYVSLSAYSTAIAQTGWCDKIGWDGAGTTAFRVPTINPRHYIIKTQEPTAENNYTWYKLYADGWVEQGGRTSNFTNTAQSTGESKTVTLPIVMSGTHYTANASMSSDLSLGNGSVSGYANRAIKTGGMTTTNFIIDEWALNNSSGTSVIACWQVSGMSSITPQTTTRVMIQIANGATDQALETCTGVLADVAGLKDMSNITATGKTNMLQDILGGLQTTDSSKVGYLQYYFEANNAVNAPAGGKWLVLDLMKISNSNGAVFAFSADFTSPVGSIVAGGTQIAAARNGYTTRVLLLKVE